MALTPIRGKDLGIFVQRGAEYIRVGCARSVSLTQTASTIDVACVDTGDWAAAEYDRLSWEASVDGVLRVATTPDAVGNVTSENFFDLQAAKTKVVLQFTDNAEGHPLRTGTALITSVEESGDLDGEATFSVSFQGTGPLTKTLVPTA